MTKLIDRHIPVKKLLTGVRISTTPAPRSQGNSKAAIWPIFINGEPVKTNPIGVTPDAHSIWASNTLDRVGVDRSTAMRFGLSFYALIYGNLEVLPDVVFKLGALARDARVVVSLKGIVDELFEAVTQLAPPENS